MSGIQQLLLGGSPAGYQIERSLRFNSADSAYLNRTPASAGNRRTWTWSGWVKRSALGTGQQLFSAGAAVSDQIFFQNTTDVLKVYLGADVLVTSQVFRDVGAWFHLVLAIDTTQATSSNRAKLYINGTQVTAFSSTSYPVQNYDTKVNDAVAHNIGRYQAGASDYFNGYLTEVNFIDGQALTPSDFGETDSATGVWKPKKYTGTYGTNGFYLNFSDNSNTTAATLGKDSSGNGNNWTPNNFSVTAGAGNDSLVDTPTSYGTDTGAGGEVRGNYCVLNAVSAYSGLPLTEANIQTSAVPSGGNWYSRSATMGISSGKWYAEFSMPSITSGSQGNPVGVGIIPASNDFSAAGQLVGDTNRGYGFYCPDTAGSAPVRRVSSTNTSVGTGTATATTDVFMVAFDLTSGTAWFGKNGTWYAGNPSAGTGASITGIVAGEYVFGVSVYRDNTFTNNTVAINFGQRPFAYTAPSGFKALCTQNLPTPTIGATSTTQANKYFDINLWTGNGADPRALTNSGSMQPDLVWIKARGSSTLSDHVLDDAVRGATLDLFSNLTNAEQANNSVRSFNSNGFSVGDSTRVNQNSITYVGWQWNAGGSNATNTSGTITSTVRANTTAGFSIVTYTGTGANATVGHGLGVDPKLIFIKRRNSTSDWSVYYNIDGLGAGVRYLLLNSTAAGTFDTTYWNSTVASTTVFSLGTNGNPNTNTGTYVAYCFAAVAGYSAFGSYTGNGSTDGPFVYTGFRPRWVMVKKTSATSNWSILDTARDDFNVADNPLLPNTSGAETTSTSTSGAFADILSNGFKARGNSGDINDSGATYIYAAFAETAFKWALGR